MSAIPSLYYKMDMLGMLDFKSQNYLSVGDMEWIPIEKISETETIPDIV